MLETIVLWVGLVASLTTIGGVAYAVLRYLDHRRIWKNKVRAVEEYLEGKARNPDPGQSGKHTVTHIMRHVGLPEDDVLRICFESELINPYVRSDNGGKATELLFQHNAAEQG